MKLPDAFLDSLACIPSFNRGGMEEAHALDAGVSVRFGHRNLEKKPEWAGKPIPWSASGIMLEQRPLFVMDPLWHAGCYYVQEAGSMFLDHVLGVLPLKKDEPATWLDLCAAPGGKSLILADHLGNEDVLICNEVIADRNAVLRENITRWGNCRTLVTRAEAEVFTSAGASFDVVLADVPCSGSGLFRRDPRVAENWSAEQVAFCAARQKKILRNILPCLREGGFLIYATCSFSREENEEILDYLFEQEAFTGLRLELPSGWGITETESPVHGMPGYRFWPDKNMGEGFFIAILQRTAAPETQHQKKMLRALPPVKGALFAEALGNTIFYRSGNEVVQATPQVTSFFETFGKILGCRQWGLPVLGEEKRLIFPLQGLACSREVKHDYPRVELTLEESLKYLGKQALPGEWSRRGFVLCTYKEVPMGFGKSVGTRINNLYPSGWRIRKTPETESSDFKK